MTDEIILIKQAKRGNNEAFDELLKNYDSLFFKLGSMFKLDKVEIDEVAQNTRIKIFKNLNKFKSGNFQGWVGSLFKNCALDYLRHKKCEEQYKLHPMEDSEESIDYLLENVPTYQTPAAICQENDFAAIFWPAFNKSLKFLSSKNRKIVQECLVEGRSYSEASKRLKIKPGSIMSGLYNAKRYLRVRLSHLRG